MPLANAGRNRLAALAIGESVTAFDEANAHLGVGDSDTAFNAAHTDLQAGTNKLRQPMEAGYPQISDNQLVFRAEFDTSQANFDWEEWGVFSAASGGVMLNRKVESLGTKPDTQTWQLTTTLTLNNP